MSSDYAQEILDIVTANDGIRARDIADQIGIDKRIVNGVLYGKLKRHCYVDSTYKWYSLAKQSKGNNTAQTQTADVKLNMLCKYYLDCLSYEKNTSVSAFINEIAEIDAITKDALCKGKAYHILASTKQTKDRIAYVGYPLALAEVYSRKTKRNYKIAVPVFLFQIDLNTLAIAENPTLNMEIVKRHAYGNESDTIREYIRIVQDLGLDKENIDFELDDVLAKLQATLPWAWQERLDPENLRKDKTIAEFSEPGIYNRAAVCLTTQPLYTQGLETEIDKLSKMSEKQYEGTALYSWIHGNSENEQNDYGKDILEVLRLNLEQRIAIEHALNDTTTVVTGPPGTGKSQVVADLLINMAWQGKKVLFASKNNKAVDVVEARVNSFGNRPVVLRAGNYDYNARFNELIKDYLSAQKINPSEEEEYNDLKEKYEAILKKCRDLDNAKQGFTALRNKTDKIEDKLCTNETWRKLYKNVKQHEIDRLNDDFNLYRLAKRRADRSQVSLFENLFWGFIVRSRENDLKRATEKVNSDLSLYRKVDISRFELPNQQAETKIEDFIRYLYDLAEYQELMQELGESESLEDIDRELFDNQDKLSEFAVRLWEKWLQKTKAVPTAELRTKMTAYLSALKLVADQENLPQSLRENMRGIYRDMVEYFPCYAITSLSVQRWIPFQPAIFDLVIVDEASQCDIASALPLLYRAKRAIIIGDPKQLSHICQISKEQEIELLNKYGVGFEWAYSENSLYALASAKVDALQIINLKDHHRSHAEIINFSNKQFYDSSLRVATDYKKLKRSIGIQSGVRWIDIHGKTTRPKTGSAYNEEEANAICIELKRLADSGYNGSIGVVTPFKAQVEKIKELVEKDAVLTNILYQRNEFLADTVHKFQGDEKDLIIFSPVIASGVSNSAIGFLKENGNLFNVAITRAKSTLLVVGDMYSCSNCGVSYLENFVKYVSDLGTTQCESKNSYPSSREYPKVDNADIVSDWEIMFYQALFDAGIKTIPQYPADKYKLDLAVISGKSKLDIEVDGERYHKSWNNELCYRDQLRNQRLFELGWDVKRFWVYQIRDELDWCVKQVKEWVNKID